MLQALGVLPRGNAESRLLAVDAIAGEQGAVGRHNSHARCAHGVVHSVVGEHEAVVIIHVIDEQSACLGVVARAHAGHAHVPTLVLEELEHVVFAGIRGIDNLYGMPALEDIGEPVLPGFGDGAYLSPAHGLALPGGVGRGTVAAVDVFAAVHQAPVLHALVVHALCPARRGVEVGQTEAV